MSLRIVLADDHQILRDGLRGLINGQPGMEVIGEAADGRTTVELARTLAPDVVIMDIGMPDLNGIEATRQIVAQVPTAKVIALSMHSDSRFVTGMLKAGASGYLAKDCAFEELARAIRAVAANRVYLSPGIAGLVVKEYVGHLPVAALPATAALTGREREVLQLLAEGRSTKDIATRLHLSVKTIETHRQKIMNRLGLRSVAELTKWAIREGVTSLER
jgi:two-component system response regulator NreC